MHLLDIVHRKNNPEPWAEGEKIPWNDPGFSRRMLQEHLEQEHDAASRRLDVIDGHVTWIHDMILEGRPARVLDLACGPGLYTNRLAALGHRSVGVDFSPATIAYAREQACREGLEATHIEDDIRKACYGDGYGLVMLIFGELNVFRREEAIGILKKAHGAMMPDGVLLLEPHTFDAVREIGSQPHSWYSANQGLFSDMPHLCLQENFWDAECRVAIERFYIVDAATGTVTRHSASTQAYTDDDYRSLLAECGFGDVEIGLPPAWNPGDPGTDLTLVLANRKRTA
jgi:SAM-dependent methyltransferase